MPTTVLPPSIPINPFVNYPVNKSVEEQVQEAYQQSGNTAPTQLVHTRSPAPQSIQSQPIQQTPQPVYTQQPAAQYTQTQPLTQQSALSAQYTQTQPLTQQSALSAQYTYTQQPIQQQLHQSTQQSFHQSAQQPPFQSAQFGYRPQTIQQQTQPSLFSSASQLSTQHSLYGSQGDQIGQLSSYPQASQAGPYQQHSAYRQTAQTYLSDSGLKQRTQQVQPIQHIYQPTESYIQKSAPSYVQQPAYAVQSGSNPGFYASVGAHQQSGVTMSVSNEMPATFATPGTMNPSYFRSGNPMATSFTPTNIMPSPLGPAGLTNYPAAGEPTNKYGHKVGCHCCKCRGRCGNWVLEK